MIETAGPHSGQGSRVPMYLPRVQALRAGRAAAIACILAGVLAACGYVPTLGGRYVPPMTEYSVRNDSDSTAIVQFSGMVDHPGPYAFSVPAGANGILYLLQGWTWKGGLAVLDKKCRAEWEQLIDVVGREPPFRADIGGGSLAIAKDRTVTWAPGKPVPIGSSPPPGPWQWFAESPTCGRSVFPDNERP